MGGGSSSKSNSTTKKKYATTTTANPYVTSTTSNKGTTTTLAPNTALSSIYSFTNDNMDRILDEYLNPSLDSASNQAKMDLYTKTLNDETRKNLENNIIMPLAERNMIRSSQAQDLYQNLANKNQDSISDYASTLIADSQNNTGNYINTLLNAVLQGYNVISGNQAQSLSTSSGNAVTKGSGSGKGTSYGM